MINNFLVRFAGWGPCGPLNEEHVYDFFGLSILIIFFAALAAYPMAVIFIKLWYKKNRSIKVLGIISGLVSALLYFLAFWNSVSETIRYYTKEDFFCDPISSSQYKSFAALLLMVVILLLSLAYLFIKERHKKLKI